VPISDEALFRAPTKRAARTGLPLEDLLCAEAQPRKEGLLQSEVEEDRFYADVVQSVGDAIITKTFDGRITSWNRAAERLFGFTAEEAIGQSIGIIVPPGCRDEIDRLLERSAKGEHVDHFETVRRTKDGRLLDVSLSVSPIKARSGKSIGAAKIVRDITGRKQAEVAVEAQNAQLRRSNAELEQFAYIASHDLQEPLRMVANFTELLQARYRDQLDDRAHQYIGYAVEGAKRMQGLVRDLLAYSRVTSVEKVLKPVDSGAVAAAVIERLSAAIVESGAKIHVHPLPVVVSDELELGQVIQNLISNAVKFHSDRAPRIDIAAEREDRMWKFSVADNGIGIDDKFSDRIFQMFQRLHERGKFEGSGIGLAIAKKITERHGGRIWFVSSLGQGTTFFFTLPAQDQGQ
jgi:PAS domain S-box-containing protein